MGLFELHDGEAESRDDMIRREIEDNARHIAEHDLYLEEMAQAEEEREYWAWQAEAMAKDD